MTHLLVLIPVALLLGLTGLAAFIWSLRHRQYEDLQGDAYRILQDNDDRPLPALKRRRSQSAPPTPADEPDQAQ